MIIIYIITLDKIFSRRQFEIFFLIFFPQKTGFDISYKLSMETVCMKRQIQFSGQNKKNITNVSSAELAKSGIKD